MKIIGITGGIGSGKSAILKLLKDEYQAYIVETDVLAHELMKPAGSVYPRIVACFGREVVGTDKALDRKRLGEIVFYDENKLQMLNQIVHPAVKEYILSDIHNHKIKQDVSLYIIESAILLEDGYREICDEIWYIYVEKEERIRRLIKSRGGTRQKWLDIMKNQKEDSYYKLNCEHIVNNSENFTKTANIVKELLFLTT